MRRVSTDRPAGDALPANGWDVWIGVVGIVLANLLVMQPTTARAQYEDTPPVPQTPEEWGALNSRAGFYIYDPCDTTPAKRLMVLIRFLRTSGDPHNRTATYRSWEPVVHVHFQYDFDNLHYQGDGWKVENGQYLCQHHPPHNVMVRSVVELANMYFDRLLSELRPVPYRMGDSTVQGNCASKVFDGYAGDARAEFWVDVDIGSGAEVMKYVYDCEGQWEGDEFFPTIGGDVCLDFFTSFRHAWKIDTGLAETNFEWVAMRWKNGASPLYAWYTSSTPSNNCPHYAYIDHNNQLRQAFYQTYHVINPYWREPTP